MKIFVIIERMKVNSEKVNEIIIKNDFSIKSVLNKIEKTSTFTGGQGFVIVVDEDGVCIGVDTDGDIRRKT